MVTAEAPAGKMACAQAPGRRGVYGALDLGTNNCRLLIVEPEGEGFHIVDSFSKIGLQVVPLFFVFQTFPAPAPT